MSAADLAGDRFVPQYPGDNENCQWLRDKIAERGWTAEVEAAGEAEFMMRLLTGADSRRPAYLTLPEREALLSLLPLLPRRTGTVIVRA